MVQVGDIITTTRGLAAGSVIRVVDCDHTFRKGMVFVRAESGYWFTTGAQNAQENVGNGRATFEVLALPLA